VLAAQLLRARVNVMATTAKTFREIQVLACIRGLRAFEAQFRTVTVFMTIIVSLRNWIATDVLSASLWIRLVSSSVDVGLL
jgi:hypothetical protein